MSKQNLADFNSGKIEKQNVAPDAKCLCIPEQRQLRVRSGASFLGGVAMARTWIDEGGVFFAIPETTEERKLCETILVREDHAGMQVYTDMRLECLRKIFLSELKKREAVVNKYEFKDKLERVNYLNRRKNVLSQAEENELRELRAETTKTIFRKGGVVI